ncbi:transcriptional repressor [Roseibium denhamense]|uniref:Fur family transcriptional regulator, zinc uptake regulator n=1 Tax=Roseibium denhamense TaxID=76305 RepID=A0ABY1NTY5_9HYPH|nr:Fur family transcriptional regulator [Roseibium denhamense]MTI05491.1 transcriptional repressor [Roseibium denhamense]SMP18188.1 Fur family transcriptional regulator, zinc uptake regulator [Roseibium denhamense]
MTAHVHPHLTKNQALVFGSLTEAEGPLTAYAILDHLRDSGFRAPLQVYRALDKLVEYGLVHRLESLNAFVACSHSGCASHKSAAFAICDTCGQVVEFSPDEAIDLLTNWTQDRGFQLSKTTIELRGVCQKCAAAN